MEIEEVLLTEHEAAKAAKLSTRTLFNLRQSGDLAYVKIGAKCIRYRVSDIKGLAAKFLVTTAK